MNNDTQAKFAAILAAAQAKANAKTANRPTPPPMKKAPETKPPETPQVNDYFDRVRQFSKPEVKDIFPNIATAPEMSNITFADLMNNSDQAETIQPAPAPQKQPTVNTGDIKLLEYSERSFAVIGEGTRAIQKQLEEKGGKYNRFLKCGKGFIFSKKKYFTVKTLLESIAVK